MLGATAVKAATSGSQTQGMNPWIQLVFGAVLVLMALVNLRSYNSTDAPKVFDTIQGMGPGAVFVLALGVTLFNPKNLALLLSAGNTMREAEPAHRDGSHRQRGVHACSRCRRSSRSSATSCSAARRPPTGSTRSRRRCCSNNHKIMFWVCAVLGAVFLFESVPALLRLEGERRWIARSSKRPSPTPTCGATRRSTSTT